MYIHVRFLLFANLKIVFLLAIGGMGTSGRLGHGGKNCFGVKGEC